MFKDREGAGGSSADVGIFLGAEGWAEEWRGEPSVCLQRG